MLKKIFAFFLEKLTLCKEIISEYLPGRATSVSSERFFYLCGSKNQLEANPCVEKSAW